MKTMSFSKAMVILAHAFVGWALCGAIMGIGPGITSMENTLITHAIAAPLIFIAVSLVYFKKFNYMTPLITAIIFVAFALFMDFFVVSLLILKNFEMFASVLGLWIPMALIFAATLSTGMWSQKKISIGAVA